MRERGVRFAEVLSAPSSGLELCFEHTKCYKMLITLKNKPWVSQMEHQKLVDTFGLNLQVPLFPQL